MSEDKSPLQIPEFIEKGLENMMDEPSKRIGKTFADIWDLVLGTTIEYKANIKKLKYAVEYEKYKEKIEQEIERIPIQNRCSPDLQIIGSALEASKYCVDKEELRDLFAKLIASSINVEKRQVVHPMFIDILHGMSWLDACIFDDIAFEKMSEKILNVTPEELALSFATLVQLGILENENWKKVYGDRYFNLGIPNVRALKAHYIVDEMHYTESMEKLFEYISGKKVHVKKTEIYQKFRDEFQLTYIGEVLRELCK